MTQTEAELTGECQGSRAGHRERRGRFSCLSPEVFSLGADTQSLLVGASLCPIVQWKPFLFSKQRIRSKIFKVTHCTTRPTLPFQPCFVESAWSSCSSGCHLQRARLALCVCVSRCECMHGSVCWYLTLAEIMHMNKDADVVCVCVCVRLCAQFVRCVICHVGVVSWGHWSLVWDPLRDPTVWQMIPWCWLLNLGHAQCYKGTGTHVVIDVHTHTHTHTQMHKGFFP